MKRQATRRERLADLQKRRAGRCRPPPQIKMGIEIHDAETGQPAIARQRGAGTLERAPGNFMPATEQHRKVAVVEERLDARAERPLRALEIVLATCDVSGVVERRAARRMERERRQGTPQRARALACARTTLIAGHPLIGCKSEQRHAGACGALERLNGLMPAAPALAIDRVDSALPILVLHRMAPCRTTV